MKLIYNIILIAFLTSTYQVANAQISWGGTTENQAFNFGFLFQGVSSDYKIQKTADWNQQHIIINTDGFGTAGQSETYPLSAIIAEPAWGGALGFLASYNPTAHVSVRLTPSYVFGDRKVRYVFNTDAPPVSKNNPDYLYTYDQFDEKGETGTAFKSVKSTLVEFPLDLKIKSDRFGNVGAYFLIGAKYSIDLGAQRNIKERITTGDRLNNTIYTNPNYYSFATGVGFTYFFDWFKMSAEVKYNQSFSNLNVPDNNLWSRPIDNIHLRSLNFSLIFE